MTTDQKMMQLGLALTLAAELAADISEAGGPELTEESETALGFDGQDWKRLCDELSDCHDSWRRWAEYLYADGDDSSTNIGLAKMLHRAGR